MSGQRVSVDADALRQVLLALMGPGRLIRELQDTISTSDLTSAPHPIKVLLKDFHDATNSPSQGPVADRSDAVQQPAPSQAVSRSDAQPADAPKEPAGTAAGVEAAAVGDAVRPGAAVLTQRQPEWWRKRADEIEADVARSGSTDAMRCYTDMRTLLQAATTPFPVKQEAPAQAVQAVPDGWKLVPVEPTDKMVQATHHLDLSYMPDQWGADRAAIYRAMLAAAPAAQQPAKECWCESCDLAQGNPLGRTRMSLCPQCGDKRCPRAKHHDNACAQQERKPMVDAAAEAFNNTFHKVRAEVSMDWWQRIWAKGVEWARRDTIKLTQAEIQSGLDRVRWAEGLILQLPENHEGRNSWLLNYGTDKDQRMAEWARKNGRTNHTAQHLPSDDTEGGCIG